ncbi:P-loop NTPase fold protein [Promicromonospora sp. MS192]|uniref:YobI family P-loop NTPase n=1 Tax=Promicromonospora sp. MS192 TaxID=3412684 RepID=UPI003C2C78BD
MGDSTNASTTVPPSDASSPGVVLASLTPRYEEGDHGLYLELLKDAITRNEAHNIALTGAYGTGKSSILQQLVRDLEENGDKVVSISLSSLGAPDKTSTAEDANPAATTPTNQIQKEIVKQILYQARPQDMPKSRFRRTTRGRMVDGVLPAIIIGLLAAALLVLSGQISRVVNSGALAALAVFILAFVAVGTGTYLLLRLTRGKLVIDGISAGPSSANITLSPRSTSYFDEYLDEIVYFFDETRRNLVVFEDIDRFENTEIFETLRSLNTLLNRAQQLDKLPIRFIYAMRDSVFEQLGEDLTAADQATAGATESKPAEQRETNQAHTVTSLDLARESVERANRTKFFDLVIPVVPFISRQNARDLMSKTFNGPHFKVSPELISLVARHIADMRLVTNIWNEFRVFHRQLIKGKHPVPELDDNHLFAIVVYKNVHLADFEKIRLGTSELDALYEFGRKHIAAIAGNRVAMAATHRQALDGLDTLEYRADRMTEKLFELAKNLSSNGKARVHLGGQWLTTPKSIDAAFWRDFIKNDANLLIDTSAGHLGLNPARLGKLIHETFDPAHWEKEERPRLELELHKLTSDIAKVRHASWAQLYRSPEVTPPTESTTPVTFAERAKALIKSPLARELIERDYLDEYFSLYISPFYGDHINVNAMNYVLRQVDKGMPDLTYELSGDEVDAILRERPEAVREPSMHNISIVDHLIKGGRSAASVIADELLTSVTAGIPFINSYLRQGKDAPGLVKMLTRRWDAIFSFLVEHAPVSDGLRHALVDAALASWDSRIEYQLDESVRVYIEEYYTSFPTLTTDGSHGSHAAQLVVTAGAKLRDVRPLSKGSLAIVRAANAYTITAENLTHLTGVQDPAMDLVKKASEPIYAYTLERLDDYMALDRTGPTVIEPEAFDEIVNDVAGAHPDLIEMFVARADPFCQTTQIAKVDEVAWSALAQYLKLEPSIENIYEYIQKRGVDSDLATLLIIRPITMSGTQDEARTVAIRLLEASEAISDPATRVRVASEIGLDTPLSRSDIAPEPGELTGLLIAAGIIPDDQTSFTPDVVADPGTLEAAIARSTEFVHYMSPTLVPAAAVATVMDSRRVPRPVKQMIVDHLDQYTSGVDPQGLRAIAEYCESQKLELTEEQLAALINGAASPQTLVALIARSIPEPATVQRLVHQIGDVYAEISSYGTSKPLVPADDAHRAILSRLEEAGIVTSFPETSDGKHLRVHRHHRPLD